MAVTHVEELNLYTKLEFYLEQVHLNLWGIK